VTRSRESGVLKIRAVSNTETLFAQHGPGVRRYLSRIVGHQAAADLTQEVFLRVTRSPIPADGEAGRRAWIFKIARNIALTFIRDGRVRNGVDVRVEMTAPPTQELALVIRQALDALQPLDRDVFLLRESAGLGYDDIAAACDLTIDAVRGRLKRARIELRAALDGPLRERRERPVRLIFSEGDER
jgi:RNA polymerase sigma-70 factor (ECF subfamily)